MVKFRDRHKGAIFWVCGTGPSLLQIKPWQLPEHHIIIVCNSAVMHFNLPHYFLLCDRKASEKYYFDAMHLDQVVINLNPEVGSHYKHTHNLFNCSASWGDWHMHKDKHFPGNSTHRATSFAWCMGASKIILAGCDASGGHPYDADEDKVEQPFNEDVMLWNLMVEHNPDLPIYTIANNPAILIPHVKYEEALTW